MCVVFLFVVAGFAAEIGDGSWRKKVPDSARLRPIRLRPTPVRSWPERNFFSKIARAVTARQRKGGISIQICTQSD